MRTYADQMTDQHRIARIRPDLDAAPSRREVKRAASDPVADLLPLPTPPARPAVEQRFEVTRIDERGRLSLAAACKPLAWSPGDTPLQLGRGATFLSVTAASAPTGEEAQLLTKHRLQLPRWAEQLCGLTPGSQVLLEIDLAGEVRIYPTTVLAEALTALHAADEPAEVAP